MSPTLKHIHKELLRVKTDVALIKHILAEEGELTERAKKQLREARHTSEDKHIKLDDRSSLSPC